MIYLLGLDIGATSTRALVTGADGERFGSGSAGGGNPNAHPPAEAAQRMVTVIRDALGDIDPGSVRAGVVGLAGVSKMADPRVHETFASAWSGVGLRCPMRVAADCEVAFAAGTSEPDGTVLVAGTGSIAARIRGRRLAATAGGDGWLLGDEGSAFWLGREAVRCTLQALEGRLARTGLADAVLREALGVASGDNLRRRLITAVNAEAPIRLARFAPLVSTAVQAGDEVAMDIVLRGVGHLLEIVQAVRHPGKNTVNTPIVLVGSLAMAGNPIGDQLRAELADMGYRDVCLATDGAVGAAWLAAINALGEAATPELHARLTSP